MKKFFIILFSLFFIALISYGAYYIYYKTQYPLHQVSALLNTVELPDNFHYIEKVNDEYSNNSYEILYKDGLINTIQKVKDPLNNIDFNFLTIRYEHQFFEIDHNNKTITEYTDYFPASSDSKYIALTPINSFFNCVYYHGKYTHENHYKYHGKKQINGKTCIKVSFTTDYDNIYKQHIYYIDLSTNLIKRSETIEDKGASPIRSVDYEYHFNATDNIKTFNIEDYPNYKYKKEKAMIP